MQFASTLLATAVKIITLLAAVSARDMTSLESEPHSLYLCNVTEYIYIRKQYYNKINNPLYPHCFHSCLPFPTLAR